MSGAIERPAYLVLGASGGIGSALARELAGSGAQVALGGRNPDTLAERAQEVGGTVQPYDEASVEAVEAAARETLDRYGRLDGIANCIGSLLLKPAHLTTSQEWSETLSTNAGTAFAAVRAAARVMKGGGSVVLVSSAAARVGLANHEAIAAAKGAVAGLTLSAAASYASRGIRVNAVAPGLVRTPMTARITDNATAAKSSEAMHALGRLGEPGDVARLIAWLLDPGQSWITGQVIGADGGLASVRSRKG